MSEQRSVALGPIVGTCLVVLAFSASGVALSLKRLADSADTELCLRAIEAGVELTAAPEPCRQRLRAKQ